MIRDAKSPLTPARIRSLPHPLPPAKFGGYGECVVEKLTLDSGVPLRLRLAAKILPVFMNLPKGGCQTSLAQSGMKINFNR
jgi:hypothetical protein